jgi:hypothetical protein
MLSSNLLPTWLRFWTRNSRTVTLPGHMPPADHQRLLHQIGGNFDELFVVANGASVVDGDGAPFTVALAA